MQFVAVYGQETVVFCASQDAAFVDKLAISSTLKHFARTIVASHVRVQDVSAYAEAAGEAENVHW